MKHRGSRNFALGLVLGALALTGCAADTGPTTTPDTQTETVVQETTAPPESTVILPIPAGLSAEELGKVLMEERFTEWHNAGGVDSIYDDMFNANQGSDTYVPQLAERNANDFANALFVNDWKSNENLAHIVDLQTAMNNGILLAYIGSARSDDPIDVEGYRVWLTVDSVTETINDDGLRTLDITTGFHDNSDKNNIPHFQGDGISEWTATFAVLDGVERISDMTIKQDF